MAQSMSRRWFRVLRTPIGITATVLMVGVLTLAVVAPILWTDQADAIDTSDILAGPSAEHWAGTDNLGRDIFYRVLVATRLSVELALLATAIAVVVGLVLGTAPFLLGRRSGRTRDGVGQPRGRVPRTPARPVLRGHLRGRRQGCGAGHRTGRSAPRSRG